MISATLASARAAEFLPGKSIISSAVRGQAFLLAERLAAETLLREEGPGPEYSIRQKILARQMIEQYGSEKIIEWYLNHAYYGYMTYGIQSASKLFFNKPARDLSFSEAALLTAIAENPGVDLLKNTDPILSRQKEIIQEAVVERLLSPSEGLIAFQEIPIITLPSEQDSESIYYRLDRPLSQAVVDLSLSQLLKGINSYQLKRGGLRVLTTLDFDIQMQVDCSRRLQMDHLHLVDPMLSTDNPIDCQAGRLLPTFSKESTLLTGNYSSEVVVLNSSSGQVLAVSAEAPENSKYFSGRRLSAA